MEHKSEELLHNKKTNIRFKIIFISFFCKQVELHEMKKIKTVGRISHYFFR